MSETAPVYSKDPIVSVIEHIGHDGRVLATALTDIFTKAPQVVADVEADIPALKVAAYAAVASFKALTVAATPIEAAVATDGANVAADLAAVGSAAAIETALKDLAAKMGALYTTVIADVKGIL